MGPETDQKMKQMESTIEDLTKANKEHKDKIEILMNRLNNNGSVFTPGPTHQIRTADGNDNRNNNGVHVNTSATNQSQLQQDETISTSNLESDHSRRLRSRNGTNRKFPMPPKGVKSEK